MSRRSRVVLFVVVAALVVACGGGEGGERDPGTSSPGTTQSAPSNTNPPGTSPSPGGTGGGTIMIGAETWDIVSFDCAIGADETRSQAYPFSARGAARSSDGMMLGVTVEVFDRESQSRLTGPGVEIQLIELREQGPNPTVDWKSDSFMTFREIDLTGQDDRRPLITSFTADGDTRQFSAEGTFLDTLAGEPGGYPDSAFVEGRIEARCR